IAQFASSNKAQNFRTSIRKESTEDSARYIYRLVDKDRVLAYYQDQFLSKEEAVLAKMKISRLLKRNLNYLQLCLGTAVIKEVSGNKNKKTKSYSYQIRAHNIQYKHAGPINEELVIFESFESFPTKEQALEAFRSEEHTSELQSRENLVCRLLLERPCSIEVLQSFPTRRSSDLCLGTAVIKEVSGNKNKKTKSYSYQIRAHNIQYKHAGPINEELVIFESFESFPTKEQALEAF